MILPDAKREVRRIDSYVSPAVSWASAAWFIRFSRLTAACGRGVRTSARSLFVVLLVVAMAGCSSKDTKKQGAQAQTKDTKAEKAVNYCALASKDELGKLYRKPLFSTPTEHGCMWSEKPGGIADLSLSVHDYQRKLRTYFATDLPKNVKLLDITDLGDSGLMTVVDGELGIVVVRKGNRVLQSATLLDIKPGSEGQKILWRIYERALNQ